MATNVAVGLLRPPHVFFYEVDHKDWLGYFWQKAKDELAYFSLYETKHGYHIIGYPYRKEIWDDFKRVFPSDFTKELRPRWNKRDPQVLRISEKWDLKTGKVTSPKPKLVCGNFFLEEIMNYKVLYYAK